MKLSDIIQAMHGAGIDDAAILRTVAILDEEQRAKGRARVAKCLNNKRNANVKNVNNVSQVLPLPAGSPPAPPLLEPLSNSQESPPKGGPKKPENPEFVEFWTAYPHKVEKAAARKAWPKAREKAHLSEILDGLQRYIRAKPPPPEGPPWCNPATWLNGERWADQPQYASRAPPKPVRRDPLTRQIIH